MVLRAMRRPPLGSTAPWAATAALQNFGRRTPRRRCRARRARPITRATREGARARARRATATAPRA
eukprot:8727706-Pyramimonas_sp.AAC.1